MAEVNNSSISRWELDCMMSSLAKQGQRTLESLSAKERALLACAAFESLVSEKLLIQEALRMGVPGLEEQVEKSFQERVQKAGSAAALKKEWEADGLTLATFRERLGVMIMEHEVLVKWAAAVPPTLPAEAKIFYDANEAALMEKKLTYIQAEPELIRQLHLRATTAEADRKMGELQKAAHVLVIDPELHAAYKIKRAGEKK